jgi:hypothetical protein
MSAESIKELLSSHGQQEGEWEAQRIIDVLDDAGYVIVPKKPTGAMVEAALAGLCKNEPDLPCGHDIGGLGARAIWRVMVKAWTGV